MVANSANIGFTTFPQFFYSPVKNNAVDAAKKVAAGMDGACAATGEADFYSFGRRLLGLAGRIAAEGGEGETAVAAPCTCAEPEGGPVSYNNVPVVLQPSVSLSPSFGVTTGEVASKVRGGSISARSTLVLDGEDIILDGLVLDGALIVKAVAGASVQIRGLAVTNAGWEYVPLAEGEEVPEHLTIRGFKLLKNEERLLEFTEPGTYEVTE